MCLSASVERAGRSGRFTELGPLAVHAGRRPDRVDFLPIDATCDRLEVTGPTLLAAAVKPGDKRVALTWTVVGNLPTRGTSLLSTTLVGGDDGPIHQFGIKFLDGTHISAFVFDHLKAYQYNFPQVSPARVGNLWTAVFPVADVEVAESGRWTAVLNLDGDDAGSIDGSL